MNIEISEDYKEVNIDGQVYVPKRSVPKGKHPSDICPKCGSDIFYTIDSRQKEGHRIRRKTCCICETRWTTVEYRV